MTESILELTSGQSLFPELAVTVDGTQYVCRRLVRSVMRKHYQWEIEMNAASKAGDVLKVDDLIFAHLAYLLDVDEAAFDDLEADEVHAALNLLCVKIARRKVERTAEIIGEKKTKPDAEQKKKPTETTPGKRSKDTKKNSANASA